MARKKVLGKGLGALIESPLKSNEDLSPRSALVSLIDPNPYQPRTDFSEKDIRALSDSIKSKGLLEPLLVCYSESGRYLLIAGERRLRASKLAGLESVPIIVRENINQSEMLELALIENLHRTDLNPIEEAESYQRLSSEFKRSQEEIARLSGRDRSTVSNLMRLLSLPSAIQIDVRQARLSAGHARALLSLPDDITKLKAREQILSDRLSVRETESLVKKILKSFTTKKTTVTDDAFYESLADKIALNLGSKVRIVKKGKGGRIEINYASSEELERLMGSFGVRAE